MKTPSEINAFFEDQVLTEEELQAGIQEAKRKKWWAEKNKDNPQLKEPEIKQKKVGDNDDFSYIKS